MGGGGVIGEEEGEGKGQLSLKIDNCLPLLNTALCIQVLLADTAPCI